MTPRMNEGHRGPAAEWYHPEQKKSRSTVKRSLIWDLEMGKDSLSTNMGMAAPTAREKSVSEKETSRVSRPILVKSSQNRKKTHCSPSQRKRTSGTSRRCTSWLRSRGRMREEKGVSCSPSSVLLQEDDETHIDSKHGVSEQKRSDHGRDPVNRGVRRPGEDEERDGQDWGAYHHGRQSILRRRRETLSLVGSRLPAVELCLPDHDSSVDGKHTQPDRYGCG